MKIALFSRRVFWLAFIVILVSNLFVLIGVAFNRSGDSNTQISLSERELKKPYRSHKENSGLSLRLEWRALDTNENNLYASFSKRPAWLDAEKLKSLGFTIMEHALSKQDETYKMPLSKERFIVLEYNGEAYKEALRRAHLHLDKAKELFKLNSDNKRLREAFEAAEKRLNREQTTASRLFAIDAGTDPETLREKYSDQTRFMILKGIIVPDYAYKKDGLGGYIKRLSIEQIHITLEDRYIFKRSEPRYKVTLAYGRRYEPWIVSIQPVDR